MKEIRDIVRSYHELKKQGKRCALATIVHLEGSSYRRPGARMLISEDGSLTGAISGGCLEGDAMRKALLVINEQVPTLVTYDTMDDDDAIIGVGLGCNGIIKILIEPIDDNSENNPIHILQSISQSTSNTLIATYFSLKLKKQPQSGTKFMVNEQEKQGSDIENIIQNELIKAEIDTVFKQGKSSWLELLQKGEELTIFLELIPPTISLVVIGAGNDVMPLLEMADILGWDTTVIDGRSNYAKQERFAKTCEVIVAKPEEILQQVQITPFTFFALMTHNYNYDKAILHLLSKNNANYIAMLGPKSKLNRMITEYIDENRPLTANQIDNIYSPAGLDIGAETSEEIALSIVAEIKAFVSHKNGAHLKSKKSGIHL